MTTFTADRVDILILGAGWLSHFLIPILRTYNLTYAATSRTGLTPDTVAWGLGDSIDVLPKASTVVIMFPIDEWENLKRLVDEYEKARGECMWILLGSTRGWQVCFKICLVPVLGRGSR
jgi:hypothetical protein